MKTWKDKVNLLMGDGNAERSISELLVSREVRVEGKVCFERISEGLRDAFNREFSVVIHLVFVHLNNEDTSTYDDFR